MSENDPTIDLEPAEMEAAAKIQGGKLGILLAASVLPTELKDELIALSEKMSEAQFDELTAVLEAEFLDESTRAIDEKYRSKLAAAIEKFRSEDEQTIATMQADIKKIQSII